MIVNSNQWQKLFFEKEEEAWRANRDQNMRSPTSWLTISGLFWLDEGENSFGSAPGNKIKLPLSSSPPAAGKFILKNGKTIVIAHKDTHLKLRGKEIKRSSLKGDDSGSSDIIELNDLRMWVIKRGAQWGIRLRDLNSPSYKNYAGLDFFPPSKSLL